MNNKEPKQREVNIGSGNDLVPPGMNPLSETIPSYIYVVFMWRHQAKVIEIYLFIHIYIYICITFVYRNIRTELL